MCIHKHKHLESNLEEAEADIQTLSDECNNLNSENESYSKKVRQLNSGFQIDATRSVSDWLVSKKRRFDWPIMPPK